MKYYSYKPDEGHGLAHDPIPFIVGPRPIGWISTSNKVGQANLAPYSFFNIFSYSPPIVGFSSVGMKDTITNALETGVFVCNIATKDFAVEVESSSERLPYGVNEFAHVGLDFDLADETRAPKVANALIALECRLTQRLDLLDLNNVATKSTMVFGQIVKVHIAESLLKNGELMYADINQILRGGNVGAYVEVPRDSHFQT